jgi:hypothetical protein
MPHCVAPSKRDFLHRMYGEDEIVAPGALHTVADPEDRPWPCATRLGKLRASRSDNIRPRNTEVSMGVNQLEINEVNELIRAVDERIESVVIWRNSTRSETRKPKGV